MKIEPVSFSQPVSSVSRVRNVNSRQLKKLDTLPKIDAAIKTELGRANPDVERLQFLKDKKEILEKYPNPNRLSFAELLGIEMAVSAKTSASEKITMPQFAYQAEPMSIKETLRVSYSIINRILDSQKLVAKTTASTNTNYAMAYAI